MQLERREYPRLEQEFEVLFSVVPSTGTKPVSAPTKKGLAKNISGGGLYLITPRMFKGTIKKLNNHICKLSMEFYLPDFQNKIRVLGEICRVKDSIRWWKIFPKHWELGVRFTHIQPQDKDSIIKYIINKQIEDHLVKKK